MADHELIRETMVSLGEGMQDCGYDAVLETVEGNGLVGRAVSNPRHDDQLRIIVLYLKDLAKTIKAESPSPERTQAMRLLQEAWEAVRAAVHEEEEEADIKSRKNAPPPERPRHNLLQTKEAAAAAAAAKARAMPQAAQARARRPLPGTVVVAPLPAKPKPQQRPIQGSAGNHYFRTR